MVHKYTPGMTRDELHRAVSELHDKMWGRVVNKEGDIEGEQTLGYLDCLRDMLREANSIQPIRSGFTRANCLELLTQHDFDHTYTARINRLMSDPEQLSKPLTVSELLNLRGS